MAATLELNLPEYAEYPEAVESTIVDDKIVFAKIAYDQSPTNPLKDFDGEGEIYAFRREYGATYLAPDDLASLIAEHKFVVPLSYSEHGRCEWEVAGSAVNGKFVWDNQTPSGVWVPDKAALENVEGMDDQAAFERMALFAEGACKLYTAYVNGDVYGWGVAIHKLRHGDDGDPIEDADYYDYHTPIHQEDVWGYYGDTELEYMRELMKESIEDALAVPSA